MKSILLPELKEIATVMEYRAVEFEKRTGLPKKWKTPCVKIPRIKPVKI